MARELEQGFLKEMAFVMGHRMHKMVKKMCRGISGKGKSKI